jgi:hypothetical protein
VIERLTAPGPISMIPDLRGDLVVYTEGSERDKLFGHLARHGDRPRPGAGPDPGGCKLGEMDSVTGGGWSESHLPSSLLNLN